MSKSSLDFAWIDAIERTGQRQWYEPLRHRLRRSDWACHLAAISLHVAFYNLCRTHEALRMTPAMALGLTDKVWGVADLIEAALKAVPPVPTTSAPERRKSFRVIEGGKG